jgi:hypothetical protein
VLVVLLLTFQQANRINNVNITRNKVVTNPSTDTFDVTPANVEVGGYSHANYLGGDIALAQVYNRVLNQYEIAQRYAFFQRRFGY